MEVLILIPILFLGFVMLFSQLWTIVILAILLAGTFLLSYCIYRFQKGRGRSLLRTLMLGYIGLSFLLLAGMVGGAIVSCVYSKDGLCFFGGLPFLSSAAVSGLFALITGLLNRRKEKLAKTEAT